MKRAKQMRRSPIPGGRRPYGTSADPVIEQCIEDTVKECNVSRAFVIDTALADYFGIRDHERYYERIKRISRELKLVSRRR